MSLSLSSSSDASLQRYDIPAFVADLDRAIAAEPDPHQVAQAVQARLRRLLDTPDLLPPEYREPDPEHYRSHLVAVAPSGAFSVVSLVWLPGQFTPIHDHICWCVVGVLEGSERETRYHLRADDAGACWLQPAGNETMAHGVTCALVPPEENIHCVRNAGATLAISLHVYGANFAGDANHSSVNECFDHLPLRDDAQGSLVPWRRRP
jgi:predicted metal-dependent enzyme (double-stranded beta helix superfamily)